MLILIDFVKNPVDMGLLAVKQLAHFSMCPYQIRGKRASMRQRFKTIDCEPKPHQPLVGSLGFRSSLLPVNLFQVEFRTLCEFNVVISSR